MNGTRELYNASTRTHFENLNSEVVKVQNVLNMHIKISIPLQLTILSIHGLYHNFVFLQL